MTTAIRKIGALSVAATLLLLAVWYFALWHPQSHSLKAAHATRDAAEQQINELDTQVVQLHGLVKQLPADQAKLAKLQAGIPDEPSLETALDELHQVAVSSGVTLSSVGPSNPMTASNGASTTQTSGAPSITLTMSATGQPGQVTRFLQDLTTMPRVVVVDQLALASGNTTTVQINARIFYAHQSKA